MSQEAELARIRAETAQVPLFDRTRPFSIAEARRVMAAMEGQSALPDGCRVTSLVLGTVPAERLVPADVRPGRIVIHFHGSAFVAGHPRAWRGLAGRLAAASRAAAVVPDYRLAPEAPFPAAVEDAVSVYQALLDAGHRPDDICLSGDSAGGGLAVAAALAIRERGLARPKCLFVISPWADLSCAGRSHAEKADLDPFVHAGMLQTAGAAYLAGADPRTPLASPAWADLRGLPPLLIHCGSAEILLSDSVALAEAAGLADLDVRLEVWGGMVHVWHALPVGAASPAIAAAGVWIDAQLGC